MSQPNKNLTAFYEELKALLKKHNVVLDIKAEIVAVDLNKQETVPNPYKEGVQLIDEPTTKT